ncbi:hypothetical protein LEN26_012098, partial [Aphanomyces euteiches]
WYVKTLDPHIGSTTMVRIVLDPHIAWTTTVRGRDGLVHWILSNKLHAMDSHIACTRPSMTEHVRSAAMDSHIACARPRLTEHVRSAAMDTHIGYARPSLTEHCRKMCARLRFCQTLFALTASLDGLTHCMHSTKLGNARSTAMDSHIGYARPSLTEHYR